jgi:hypothetical protein
MSLLAIGWGLIFGGPSLLMCGRPQAGPARNLVIREIREICGPFKTGREQR